MREFASTEELCAWLRYAGATSSPPLNHQGNPALEPLFALLSDASCRVLPSPAERDALRNSAAIDGLVCACGEEGGVSELLTLVQRLHALHRSFPSVSELQAAVSQAAEQGFFLPRPLLQRILDVVKKGTLFGGATPLPDLDAELLDALVAAMGPAGAPEEARWAAPLEGKVEQAVQILQGLEREGKVFGTWEDLCHAAVEALKPKPAAPAPTPVAAAPAAAASAASAASTPQASAAAPEGTPGVSSMDASEKSRLMSLLNDDDFLLFDDMQDELVITAASLDALLAAAGPHGFEGLLHVLAGLNGIGRRASSFNHLIQLVGEVVEDGAYSSRADREKILAFLSDDSRCRLFVVGAASTLPESARALLCATAPASVDALILGVGGSAHVPALLQHCHALDQVGSRIDSVEEILPALQAALDPAQGNGSYVGNRERRELVSFLAGGGDAAALLPRSAASRATLEQSLRDQPALLDSVYTLASETALLMQRADQNKPMGFLFSPMRAAGAGAGASADDDAAEEEEAEERHLPETAAELVMDQLEQMASAAAASGSQPRFAALPQLLEGLHASITQLKAHTQAEEQRKQQMLKRLNR